MEWDKGSDEHPWLKVLKTQEADTVKLLVGMAFDVYNDSLCEKNISILSGIDTRTSC